MFDRYVSTKMTDCQDPYRELELYLEQAQEEIGKAIKELEEDNSPYLLSLNEAVLPPPQAFCSTTPSDINASNSNSPSPTVSRICHDGTLTDVQKTSNEAISKSTSAPFSASFNPESLSNFKKTAYSPTTRRRLWRMHPSISFPETAKDLLLIGKDTKYCNCCNANSCYSNSVSHRSKSSFNSSHQHIRQRSASDTTVSCSYPDGSKNGFGIPKPPTGDFNLLSVWANNLVLELDKTLSGEFSSASRFSPSSDYSLSPIKGEEISESDVNALNFESLNIPETGSVDTRQLSGSERNLKSMSLSPDSGIDQSCCEISDCVDSGLKSNLSKHNCDLIIPVDDVITPPPPEFGDEVNKLEQQLCVSNLQKSSIYPEILPSCTEFHAAVSVLEVQETAEPLQNCSKDIQPVARVIAPKTVELQDCPVLKTTCILNDVSHTFDDTVHKGSYLEGRYINSVDFDTNHNTSYTTKFQSKSNKFFKRQCTFPRDSERKANSSKFQRSISDTAVSNIILLSKCEPISWMRRKKNRLPSSADVAVDAKENQDAVTQTTPLLLSRSSSFTWVTECNCSSWELDNVNSASEESVCSNCKKERRNRKSTSSSSVGISSEDDDFVPASPGSSSSSSLYLSACSGSSDSFELIEDLKQTECEFFFPSSYSETTLRATTLGNIYEEQMTSDSFSIKSTPSNPFLIDSSSIDSREQPASFPSTLKMTKKCPSLPIESSLIPSNELNLKSVSAPVLLKQKRHLSTSKNPSSPLSNENVCNQIPARSQSAKELNELQAIEACSWLRAAGFPQYAQMYEDNQFPIDISMVQKDHAFLPQDSIQSLFRRLNALNRCANMKYVDHKPRKSLHTEDSEEEEQYALSENWEFQCSSRRWSRITATSDGVPELVPPDHQESNKTSSSCFKVTGKKYLSPEEAYCSSHDSVFVDEQHSSPDSLRRTSILKPDRIVVSPNFLGDCSPGSSSGSGTLSLVSDDVQESRSLRRSGSDRVKEGAKALLKRMESLKGKRKKKGHDSKKVESDGSSSSSLTSSPQSRRCQKLPDGLHDINLQRTHKAEMASYYKDDDDDDANAHSDSECHMVFVMDKWKNANSKQFKQTPVKMTSTPTETSLKSKSLDKRCYGQTDMLAPPSIHTHFNKNQEFIQCDKRGSYYDNISAPIVVFNDFCDESFSKNSAQMYDDGGHSVSSKGQTENEEKGEIIIINNERRDSGVGSSLTRGLRCIHAPWHCFPSHSISESKFISYPVKISELTAPQMLLLRKLSLLKLTAMMERYTPSNRTGWSWAVPKFIRRIRNPDYKDKNIFGVPLLLILQRTGQPLPVSIQAAIHYLQKTSLDSTGLFRKSGVKSRIQKLKVLNENNPENITYEGQQAYDVADMIKQYFRELPEALLTNKLSETFISIFQFIPEDLRLDAIQAALFLMPDENREVLQVLLEFLSEICQNSDVNQMTATNLAVCFAPSIFHLSSPRSSSSSPRRRKTVGVPDVRELNENRAAYECLSCMVSNCEMLFSVSEDMVAQSRIASAAFSQAVSLDEISSFIYDGQMGLKGYIDSCIQVFLKEAKEKYKNYVSFSQYDHVEISYKKLSDGHPLRVWKVSTEVEAPPSVLLNRILRERHMWDPFFMKSKIIAHLSNNTEIMQYLCSQLPPHPHCNFCILRSWRTDLPRGACVLIETSVNHPDAEINAGSVTALMLASRYLIEPCGSGKSRITHLSRVDFRGRSPEWYNRAYGHICTLLLIKLRSSFSHACTDGPETKL